MRNEREFVGFQGPHPTAHQSPHLPSAMQVPHLSALTGAALLALVGAAHAQSPKPLEQLQGPAPVKFDPMLPPTGIYCSCPPTNAKSDSVLSSVASLPFVDGILVRIAWKDIEPVKGQFDFTLLDRQLELARQFDVDIALAIMSGSFSAPDWLAAEGAQQVPYTFMGQSLSLFAPWDPILIERWDAAVRSVGAAYDGHPRIKLVHITHSTFNGFEMQLPLTAEATFTAAGYTEDKFIDAYRQVLSTFGEAWPSHALDLEVHPVFGSDAVANAVVPFGLQTLGPRFGVFGAWWSTDNATQAYPGMFDLIAQAADLTFATVQVVGSWIKSPERFDNDLAEYLDTYAFGLANGVEYYEIWNADLLDAGLAPIWDRLQRALE